MSCGTKPFITLQLVNVHWTYEFEIDHDPVAKDDGCNSNKTGKRHGRNAVSIAPVVYASPHVIHGFLVIMRLVHRSRTFWIASRRIQQEVSPYCWLFEGSLNPYGMDKSPICFNTAIRLYLGDNQQPFYK